MSMPASFLAAFTLAASLTAGSARSDDTRDLAHFFPGYTSALVVMDLSTGQATRHNPQMARRAFSPCSTFKIPNSLVGLETGVIPGPDFVLPWAGRRHVFAGIIEGKGASGRVARPMVERALAELAVLPAPSPLGARSPLEPALPPRPR